MNMDISKLPSNSNASKAKTQTPATAPTEKRVQKVVKGKVTTKKSEVRKFADIFVAEDVESVKSYVVDDLIIPTAKNLVVDVVQNFIEMLVLGGKRGSGYRTNIIDNVTYRDYNGISRNSRHEEPARTRNRFDYDCIVFTNKADAEIVIDQLDFTIRKYGLATVADVYDMCGQTAPHTANKYGWTSMSRADVRSVRGGWVLDLPKAAAID